MCTTLEAINLAQGFLGRLDQYEFVQLLPYKNPISGYDARVRQKVTGMEYDMKIYSKLAGKQKHLDRQIETLCLIRENSFTVSIYDICEDESSVAVVLSKLGKLTLHDVKGSFGVNCPEEFARSTIAKLAKILFKLHARGVVHRNTC